MSVSEIFSHQRIWNPNPDNKPGFGSTQRSEIAIEDEGDAIEVYISDGDNGGRGAERNGAAHTMTYEEARSLVEALAPVLYEVALVSETVD